MDDTLHTFRSNALQWLEGDERMFDKLSALFLKNVPQQMAVLSAAVAANDLQGAELQAHALKGAAGMIGALEMRNHAAALETAAMAGETELLQQHFKALADYVAQVTEALSRT